MRIFSIVFLLCLNNLISVAQHEYGVKLNIGVSKIIASPKSWANANESLTYHKFYYSPSWQTGIYYITSNKYFFGIESIINKVTGKDDYTIVLKNALHTLTFVASSTTSYYFLSTPLYCGIRMKRFAFTLGLQGGISLFEVNKFQGIQTASGSTQEIGQESAGPSIYVESGARTGILFKLNNRFSIENINYIALTTLKANNPRPFRYRSAQCTIGLRYRLGSI